MSLSLNIYRTLEYSYKDNGAALTVSLPLGRTGTLSLDAYRAAGDNSFRRASVIALMRAIATNSVQAIALPAAI